jgi:hypothetical protein
MVVWHGLAQARRGMMFGWGSLSEVNGDWARWMGSSISCAGADAAFHSKELKPQA